MANPFDGSALPPVYSPKSVVVNGEIWRLHESGDFWENAGVAVPPGNEPPRAVAPPPDVLQILKFASPVDQGAIALASAASVQRENETYNKKLFERFADAYVASFNKGAPAPSVAGKYRIADFWTLYSFISRGFDTSLMNPPEVVFNQR